MPRKTSGVIPEDLDSINRNIKPKRHPWFVARRICDLWCCYLKDTLKPGLVVI